MLIPSVDIQSGECVQLIGGEACAIKAGAPDPWVRRFSQVGEVAVIDIDAAKGCGSNALLIKRLAESYALRVGGGIRDLQTASTWLDAGASKIIIGTAASPELLRQLPKERLIVALDARNGEVQEKGWTAGTGRNVFDDINRLRGLTSEFLVTVIEREGRMGGLDQGLLAKLTREFPEERFTIAGGVRSAEEIAEADLQGVDVQAGMALYSGAFHEADVLGALLERRSGVRTWPTVVTDEDGMALGLVYSNSESLKAALTSRRGVYWSRRRGLWEKGATSGNTQELIGVALNCNRDSLKFIVRQSGSGFCHKGQESCFAENKNLMGYEGFRLALENIKRSYVNGPEGSWTRFLARNPELNNKKILEEATELVEAETSKGADVVHEFCDLFYFAYLRLLGAGKSWVDAEQCLYRRSLVHSRRFKNQDPVLMLQQEISDGSPEVLL